MFYDRDPRENTWFYNKRRESCSKDGSYFAGNSGCYYKGGSDGKDYKSKL